MVLWTKPGFKGMVTLRRPAGHSGTLQNFSSEEVIITVQKTPVEILVHQSLLRARLYLVSLNPRIREVIIRKNAESGPE